ncbi:transcription elongation factor spt4 [Ascobolus immersus RN42]|uniref:Transcription elongation factor SPT4 n=1 Tax=Ascobolus immersus RN42 TaxID=1160509 RepID=A0A3N4INP9_ASCIM|nr:transcription elongation factor spt4 [Ascobolus immersus RN42]
MTISQANNSYVPTSQFRKLVACMVCAFIQTASYFVKNGCPNCDEVIKLRNEPDKVDDCTSSEYEGIITIHEVSESWVAKWQRLDKYVPGIYAVKVSGNLPSEIISELRDAGIMYHARNGSEDQNKETGCG